MIRHRAARRAAGLVLAAVALAACSNEPEPTASSSTPAPSTHDDASPSPSPSPTVKLRPVVGERTASLHSLGSRPVLGLGGDPGPDEAAINAAVERVGDWLDAHLDGLQREGSGSFGQVAAKGLTGQDVDRSLVTTGLASPDAPVRKARYVMSVYHDGGPRYLTARVAVTHVDDSVATAELVFVLDEDGTPRLTMFGPGRKAGG